MVDRSYKITLTYNELGLLNRVAIHSKKGS